MSDDESAWGYPGWRVLFASVVGLAFSPGPMIFGSLGLFAPHMHTAFGWGLGQIMLCLTLFNVGGLVASPYTGRLIDRFGARAVLLPALILFMAGFVVLARMTTSLTSYYTVAFLWGLLTVGAQSITYAQLLVGWFARRRGMAIGIAAAGLGAGFTINPPIVKALLDVMDWRSAMSSLALLVGLFPFLLALMFARPRPGTGAGRPGSPVEAGMTLQEARRTPSFWYIAAAIGLMSAVLAGIVPHIVTIARDAGYSIAGATGLASLYGAATLVGRVLVGSLTDRFAPSHVAMAFFSLAAAGFAALAVAAGGAAGGPLLTAAVVLVGFGFGAESDLLAIFIGRYFGQRAFGAIYGWLLSVFILGAAIGPPVLGFGRDALGSYAALMACAAVVAVVAVLLISRMEPRPAQPAVACD